MRKNTSFAVAATIMVLSALFWIKSGVVASSADIARPKVGLSNYVVTPSPYMPLHVMEPIY